MPTKGCFTVKSLNFQNRFDEIFLPEHTEFRDLGGITCNFLNSYRLCQNIEQKSNNATGTFWLRSVRTSSFDLFACLLILSTLTWTVLSAGKWYFLIIVLILSSI